MTGPGKPWALQRTTQCAKCPWRVDVDPHQIPNGYCPTKHAGLQATIADPADVMGSLSGTLRIMACHETDKAHCVGWLSHQLGPGNNIGLRLHVMTCSNVGRIRTIGEQHAHFEDTLPTSR